MKNVMNSPKLQIEYTNSYCERFKVANYS